MRQMELALALPELHSLLSYTTIHNVACVSQGTRDAVNSLRASLEYWKTYATNADVIDYSPHIITAVCCDWIYGWCTNSRKRARITLLRSPDNCRSIVDAHCSIEDRPQDEVVGDILSKIIAQDEKTPPIEADVLIATYNFDWTYCRYSDDSKNPARVLLKKMNIDMYLHYRRTSLPVSVIYEIFDCYAPPEMLVRLLPYYAAHDPELLALYEASYLRRVVTSGESWPDFVLVTDYVRQQPVNARIPMTNEIMDKGKIPVESVVHLLALWELTDKESINAIISHAQKRLRSNEKYITAIRDVFRC